MSNRTSWRWPEHAYLALLCLLVGLWVLFPPQQIDPAQKADGHSTAGIVGPVTQKARP